MVTRLLHGKHFTGYVDTGEDVVGQPHIILCSSFIQRPARLQLIMFRFRMQSPDAARPFVAVSASSDFASDIDFLFFSYAKTIFTASNNAATANLAIFSWQNYLIDTASSPVSSYHTDVGTLPEIIIFPSHYLHIGLADITGANDFCPNSMLFRRIHFSVFEVDQQDAEERLIFLQ